MRCNPIKIVAILFLPAATLFGCDRDASAPVVSYAAPKQPAPATQPSRAASMHTHSAMQPQPQVQWSVPGNWTVLPAGQMRFAAYRVGEGANAATITVIPLSGDSGSVLANINRWEQQLGLEPSQESKLPQFTRPVEVNGIQATLVDLTGPGDLPTRMLAAIVPDGQRTWFFKMTGPAEVVAGEASAFESFVRSVQFDSVAPVRAGAGAAGGAQIVAYRAPEGWTRDLDAAPPRILVFDVGDGEKAGQLVVTKFASDNFGALPDNINRWRMQVGLESVEDPQQANPPAALLVDGREAQLFDFAGPQQRMLVAMVPADAETWFFRLSGPPGLVADQSGEFEAFLKSVQFGAAAGHE